MATIENQKSISEDITCPHYKPLAGNKRCSNYLDGGSCSRPDEFQCTEWLKRNSNRSIPKPSPQKDVNTDLFGNPIPEPKTTRQTEPKQEEAAQIQHPPLPPPNAADETERHLIRGFTTADIEGFKKNGFEVHVRSETFGEFWLVPEYTGQDRKEITPEHASTIACALHVFPGSRVEAFKKSPRKEKESN